MPDTFTAATWNVFHGTPVAQLRPTLRQSRKVGVSLYLVQEASAVGVAEAFIEVGLATFWYRPQYLLAWDPDVWMPRRVWGERLAQTPYWRKGGGKVHTDAAMAIFCDEAGRTLTAMSYHTPPHVQVPPAEQTPRRRQVLSEAADSWGRLAREAHTHACLFGGDDNVDEALRWGPWAFMLRAATGLRQVPAPAGTHGSRRIDDFRVRGLVPGDGWVQPNPSDHHLYARTFAWR